MTRQQALQDAKSILFNTDMVRAILDRRKTVTRRLAKYDFGECRHVGEHEFILDNFAGREVPTGFICRKCGLGVSPPHSRRGVGNSWIVPPCFPDDILYVRETFAPLYETETSTEIVGYMYKAETLDEYDNRIPAEIDWWYSGKWKPSIHMPKEAARIFLRVTGIRVERLQDMPFDDFLEEGIALRPEAFNDPENAYGQAKSAYQTLWNSTIKKSDLDQYGWDANPWVWVIEFERAEVTEW